MSSAQDLARRRHYGDFYGVDPTDRRPDLPFIAVMGNCQAESLRILLNSSGLVDSFRIPPVHEFTGEDVDRLRGILARADVLVTQPIRDDYRGLPLGTAQLAELLPPGAHTVTYPTLRWDGLMPYHAIVRDPADPSRNPPVVPYHDLRILAAAARGLDRPVETHPSEEALRAAAGLSIGQLRAREERHGTVTVSDVLETAPVWHTINHPSNATLAALAQRVLDHLVDDGVLDRHEGAVPQVVDPGRVLLASVQTPLSPVVLDALGLDVMHARRAWVVGGRTVPDEEVDEEHAAFYAEHPLVVETGMRKYADLLTAWGWEE